MLVRAAARRRRTRDRSRRDRRRADSDVLQRLGREGNARVVHRDAKVLDRRRGDRGGGDRRREEALRGRLSDREVEVRAARDVREIDRDARAAR